MAASDRSGPSSRVYTLGTSAPTKLLHELGAEAYAAALAEHRGIVREACAEQGGVEVDTQGDAFFVAFPTAPGALEAAAQITERLAGRPIRVRIGLAHGDAVPHGRGLRGDGRAPRGADCRVRKRRPDPRLGIDPRSPTRGRRPRPRPASLQGSRSGGARLPARSQEFPLRSLPETNLPVPATPFLGRTEELASVVTHLGSADVRLLTLTGAGGSGETRLALQSAAEVAERFARCLLDLAQPAHGCLARRGPTCRWQIWRSSRVVMYDSSGRAITAFSGDGPLAVRRYCSATIPC